MRRDEQDFQNYLKFCIIIIIIIIIMARWMFNIPGLFIAYINLNRNKMQQIMKIILVFIGDILRELTSRMS